MFHAARALLSLLLVPVLIRPVSAQECQVRVEQPLSDDLGNHWAQGKVLPVDIARTNASGGTFCASGGSCLLRVVGGHVGVTLLNCRIGKPLGNGDYSLIAAPSMAGVQHAQAMRKCQAIETKLSELGFSNTASRNLADDYVYRPQSTNAKLVERAIAGSSSAVAELKRNTP